MIPFFSVAMVLVATFMIFAYLGFIWWLDRYDREPIWLVMLTFFWGGLGGTLLAIFISVPFVFFSDTIFDENISEILITILFAPSIEEATKAGIFLLLMFSSHFDNETDGLIYGAATGLGFACVENLLYFSNTNSFEELATLVVLRTTLTALVHAISSALVGMAFGFVRNHKLSFLKGIFFVFLGYIFAVLNHGVWNAITSATSALGENGGGPVVFLAGVSIVFSGAAFMFFLTQISVYREHKMILRVLLEEANMGTIPMDHAAILPFWLKRKKRDWLDSQVDRRKYIRITTKLAFRIQRRHHQKNEMKKRNLEFEIKKLRMRIGEMNT